MNKTIFIVLIAIILTGVVWGCKDKIWPAFSKETLPNKGVYVGTLDRQKIAELVNEYRASKGLNELKADTRLCKIASERILEITQDFTHDGFWKHKDEVKTAQMGENIIKGYYSEEATVLGWKKSPPHNKAMLDNYTNTCIATDKNYAVQIFARY